MNKCNESSQGRSSKGKMTGDVVVQISDGFRRTLAGHALRSKVSKLHGGIVNRKSESSDCDMKLAGEVA